MFHAKKIEPQDRQETSCSCKTCKTMCLWLVDAGYSNQLAPTLWINAYTMEEFALIAPRRIPGKGCAFLDGRGLCTLHDKGLKPLEGRLSIHNTPDNGLREWVCRKWLEPGGVLKAQQLETHFYQPEAENK